MTKAPIPQQKEWKGKGKHLLQEDQPPPPDDSDIQGNEGNEGNEDNEDKKGKKPSFLTLSEVREKTFAPDFTIYKYLESNTQNLLYGDSESKKTFILIDMMMSIASGREWCKQPVKRGGVVFLYGEGRGGIIRRCRAWLKYNKVPVEEVDNLMVLNRGLYLSGNGGDTKGIIDDIHSYAEARGIEEIKLIVWDTASSLLGINENKAEEVSEALKSIKVISQECGGASDYITHHMGHNSKDRPRGSYAWMANIDSHHRVEKVSRFQSKIIAHGKMKDGEPISYNRIFDLNYQELGIDDQRNEFGSLVAEHIGNQEADKGGPKVSATGACIEHVRSHTQGGGIFLEEVNNTWESYGFTSPESCRTSVAKLLSQGRIKKPEGEGSMYREIVGSVSLVFVYKYSDTYSSGVSSRISEIQPLNQVLIPPFGWVCITVIRNGFVSLRYIARHHVVAVLKQLKKRKEIQA